MIKTTYVAILLLFSEWLLAAPLTQSIQKLETDWATAYYTLTDEQQRETLAQLIQRAEKLSQQHPDAAEPKIWHAVLLSTQAANLPPFDALEAVDKARKLLEQSLILDPTALKGTAYTTLGTLYFMTPGWPISFGDEEKARVYLKKGLAINPDGIDSNYFYAKFLLNQGQDKAALVYLKKALKAPLRPNQRFADTKLKQEVVATLNNNHKENLAQVFSTLTYPAAPAQTH